MGLDPADLPEWMEYRAQGNVCLCFHPAPWPDVWMVHLGVNPQGWGRLVEDATAILSAFWLETNPRRIVAWIEDDNRAAIAFARRCGFVTDGAFPSVHMMGWTKCR